MDVLESWCLRLVDWSLRAERLGLLRHWRGTLPLRACVHRLGRWRSLGYILLVLNSESSLVLVRGRGKAHWSRLGFLDR